MQGLTLFPNVALAADRVLAQYIAGSSPGPPANLSVPLVEPSSVYIGEQIASDTPFFGDWTSPITSYTFQWQDSLDGVTLNGDVAGATSADYVAEAGEDGRWLRVEVTGATTGNTGGAM